VFTFTAASLAFFWAGTFVLSDSWRALVVLSIAGSALTLAVTCLWAYWLGRLFYPDRRTAIIGASATFIAGAFCGYAHLFSPWGVHNIGVLGLVAAGFATSRALWKLSRADDSVPWGSVAAVQAIALYTHWTNLFLLPPATLLAIVLCPGLKRRQRTTLLAAYIGGCVVLALPILLRFNGSSDFAFAAYSSPSKSISAGPFLFRAWGWVLAAHSYFSISGLLLAVTGLIALAVSRRIWFPLALLVTHWCMWTALPGFTWNGSPTELRTYNYLLPCLWLGIGYAFICAATAATEIRSRIIMLSAASLLFVAHLTSQTTYFTSPQSISSQFPTFWNSYLTGQGTLGPLVRNVDARIGPGATLMVSSYPLQDSYFVLSRNRAPGLVLDTLWQREKAGNLAEHLHEFGEKVPCSPMYVLADSSSDLDLRASIAGVLGPTGLDCGNAFTLEEVTRYATDKQLFGDVSLYRVRSRQ